jgi:hypothetical protein
MLLLRGKSTYPGCSDFRNRLFAAQVRAIWKVPEYRQMSSRKLQHFLQHDQRHMRKALETKS